MKPKGIRSHAANERRELIRNLPMPEMPDADERYTVINRAMDWLDQHPDRHATGALVSTTQNSAWTFGRSVPLPEDKENTKLCFCALGRISVEAGLDPTEGVKNMSPTDWPAAQGRLYAMLSRYLEPFNVGSDAVVEINDVSLSDDHVDGDEAYYDKLRSERTATIRAMIAEGYLDLKETPENV